MINSKRRQFMKACAASLVIINTPSWAKAAGVQSSSLSGSSPQGNKKFVWVVLRGAMDSLSTVVPTFDKNLAALRPTIHNKINEKLLPLDQGFALHPSLVNLHQWYKNKELTPIVAVGSGYGARSHFDGQDFLESGLGKIDYDSGWLGRAINVIDHKGLAIARSTPISMRGSKPELTSTWYPTNLKDADEDIYESLMRLYQDDNKLSATLASGLDVQSMTSMGMSEKKQKGKFIDLSKTCAQLLAGDNEVDCAMLEMGGWDTHNNQQARLTRQLSELDQGLQALKAGLKNDWENTVVVVASEFGRTAKENGTGGTDHGTGGAMFLAGGAIKGGQVLGQWPGLSTEQLFEQRDLLPTSNTHEWIATAMSQHWQLDKQQIAAIFPNKKLENYQLVT